jgi:hypothetical protein
MEWRVAIDQREMNERLIRLSEDRDVGFWAADFEALPEPKRVFRAIWELEAQVNNGGFHQYFLNGSAWTVPGIWDALQAIGATSTAVIVMTLSWQLAVALTGAMMRLVERSSLLCRLQFDES